MATEAQAEAEARDLENVRIEKALTKLDYLGSRGPSGVGALRHFVRCEIRRAGGTKPVWFKDANLHGACMNNHFDSTLPYLHDKVCVARCFLLISFLTDPSFFRS